MTQAVQWDRADEVGALAQGLDTMRVKISGLLAERERKNLELESELVERRRVEEALGLSQVKFSAIFESSPVAMSVSHNGGDFAVQDVNSAWVRVFGRSRDVAVGAAGEALGLWRDASARTQALSLLTQAGDLARFPAWLVRGDGGAAVVRGVRQDDYPGGPVAGGAGLRGHYGKASVRGKHVAPQCRTGAACQ
jgi:PAS domain-containing protein